MGSSTTEQYCLRWNDFHANVVNSLSDIRDEEDFFDVTLVSDGQVVRAHKLVLSACSPMFRTMLKKNDHPKPIIFLHGVRYCDIKAILNFMYRGEVNINQEDLNTFLAAAEELRVRGLSQNDLQDRIEDRSNLPQTSNNSPPANNPCRAPSVTPPEKRPRLEGPSNYHCPERSSNYPPTSPTWKDQHQSQSPTHCRSSNYSTRDDSPVQHIRSVQGHLKNEPRNLVISPDLPNNDYESRRSPSPSMDSDRGEMNPDKSRDPKDSMDSEAYEKRRRSDELAFFAGRSPSILDGFSPSELTFHNLGGRDTGDPLAKITVALSPKGWHCPECLHISTTKGNLKSHILSGRHKLFEKSFMCTFCRKTYSTRQSLQVHISTHHRQERGRDGILGSLGNYSMSHSSPAAGPSASFSGRYEDMGNFDDHQRSPSPYHVKSELVRYSSQPHFPHRNQGGVVGSSFDNPDTDESRDDSSGGGDPYGVPRNDPDFLRQPVPGAFER